MTLATLTDVLEPAKAGGYAVAGFVVLGWEEAVAYVQAAERLQAPVILQAGPNARRHTPLPVLGAMFRHLADHASVPVVAHLDHGASIDECRAAIAAGFSSIMFDGSRLALEENISITRRIVAEAHVQGVSVEGELGFVGYAAGDSSRPTVPEEAALFERETGLDALAISVGNVHLQTEAATEIDWPGLRAIEAATSVPLVLHGGSGLALATRRALARESRVCKFNFGTELRQAFGAALRENLAAFPHLFDRIAILEPTISAVEHVASATISQILEPPLSG